MLFDRGDKSKNKTQPPAGDEAANPTLTRRRNRMAGLWAAELLGLIGQAAHDYARELAHAEPHEDDETVIRRLSRDLHGKAAPHEIREKLSHLLHEARRQLLHEDQRKDKP